MKLRIKYGHWLPRKLDVAAITLFPWIFFAEDVPDPRTISHELVHVEQIERVGFFRFYVSYLVIYFGFRIYGWSHDAAYMGIPHETEAYMRTADKKQVEA